MGSRRQARELALQLLYQHELTQTPLEEMQKHFEGWKRASTSVREFADSLVRGTLDNSGEIDEILEEQTSNWRLDRLAAVDRNILRLALFELLHQEGTPAAVVIDEAIEVAKKFGAEESSRFINGVLDGFVKSRQKAV
ncbi:MAG: transcription antitermination factor NusB [Thermoanaerobaculales bacterium]|nr:transcription antitermination factor NusB [Thermoanaerobaculales bacterium]